MNTPTFKEQFDKLTEAYIRNEVNPWSPCQCWVGNLLNNQSGWIDGRWMLGKVKSPENIPAWIGIDDKAEIMRLVHNARSCVKEQSNGLYTLEEIVELEAIFMTGMEAFGASITIPKNPTPEYEEALFKAFEKTLDRLKEIHIAKGENIDESPVFTKRQLKKDLVNS